MRPPQLLLVAAIAASCVGLAWLLRTSPEGAAAPAMLAQAPGGPSVVAPITGSDLVAPGQVEIDAAHDARADRGRQALSGRAIRQAGVSAPRHEWRIVFTTVPPQTKTLHVRVEPEYGPSLGTLARLHKASGAHVVAVSLPDEAIARATLRVGSSDEALSARDGRPVVVTEAAGAWALGSVLLESGRRDDAKFLVTGLTVPLETLAQGVQLGQITVLPTGLRPVDVLVWTTPEKGHPRHLLLKDVPSGSPVAFRSFMTSETWCADIAPSETRYRSDGAAIGEPGMDLVLAAREK